MSLRSLVPVALLAFAATGVSQGLPIKRTVLITDRPLTGDERNAIFPMTGDRLAQTYVANGYVAVEKEGIRYLFSPSLWAQKKIEEKLAMWREMEGAVGSDGTIELANAPALASFSKVSFGAIMGFEAPERGRFMLSASSEIVISDGKVSKRVPISDGTSEKQLSRLREQPLKRLPLQGTKKLAPPVEIPGALPSPDGICALSPGPGGANIIVRMEDVAHAAEILSERYGKASSDLRSVWHSLSERLSYLRSFDGDEKNKRIDQLSPQVRNQINAAITGNYKSFGFSSENDAQNWLSNAKVSSTKTQWSLMGAWDNGTGQPAYVQFGLP